MKHATFSLRSLVGPSLLLLLLVTGAVSAARDTIAPATKRPNIVFILADDLGFGDVGILFQNHKTGKRMRTPNLDKMASQGAVLSHHYCPAPVCAPSRASLYLGVHQGHSNVRDNQFDKALERNHTIASTLRTLGYTTALIGKYGLQGILEKPAGSSKGNYGSPSQWPAYPTKRGFDYFFGYVRHGDGHNHYPAHDTFLRPKKQVWDQDRMIRDELQLCYTADLFTARAKKLLVDETRKHPDKPFFLMLCFDTPHATLQLPTMAYPEGGGLKGGVQWIGTPGHMINTAEGKIDSWRHPDYTTAVGGRWTDLEERFATSVRRVDDCVGDILKTLADLGIAEHTLVVFTSDNGPHAESYIKPSQTYDHSSYSPVSFSSFGPHEGIKRDVWEGGIREPTFVWGPGIVGGVTGDVEQPRVIDTPSQFHDWMPTFIDAAGGTPPCRTDGVSLLPVITAKGRRPRAGTVYVEYFVRGTTPRYPDFENHGGTPRIQCQTIRMEGSDGVWYTGVRTNIRSHSDDFEIYQTDTDPKQAINLMGRSAFFTALQNAMKNRVLEIRQPNASAPRPYDTAPVHAVSVPASELEAGLAVASYEGTWPWLPEFRDLQPVATGSDSNFSVARLTRPSDAGLLFTGLIRIPAEGVWTFKIQSDSGAALRIHESQVIDDDFRHGAQEAGGTIRLAPGLHPFRLYYRSKGANPSLAVRWAGPDVRDLKTMTPIPDAALFRKINTQ